MNLPLGPQNQDRVMFLALGASDRKLPLSDIVAQLRCIDCEAENPSAVDFQGEESRVSFSKQSLRP